MDETILPSSVMELPPPPLATLSLPSESDSLETLTAKLSSFLYVAYSGRSIAAATGHAVSAFEQPTAEARAKSQMKPLEREYFQNWEKNAPLILPTMDWDRDHGQTPSTGRPLKRALRRAEALNRIYRTDQAQPSHYYFFLEHHSLWLPLVTAVVRVIGAERNRRDSELTLSKSKNQLSTIQTIIRTSRRISARSEKNVTRERVLQQITCLETIHRSLRKEQSDRGQCLGKRKLAQLTSFTTHDVDEAMSDMSGAIDG